MKQLMQKILETVTGEACWVQLRYRIGVDK